MELFFDTSEEKTDVREHTGKIETLMMVNAQEHRPPLLRFSWETSALIVFWRTLSSVLPCLRMMVLLYGPYQGAIQGILHSRDAAFKYQTESADHTKRLVVREGESLSSLSAREYNDPGKWRVIADANRIDDPENVKSGTIVELPPLY